MPTSSNPIGRRRLLLAGTSVLALAACGGGENSGRIEPGLGAVGSGAPVESGVPDRDFSFRLIVEVPGKPAIGRVLQVGVRYRYQYGFTFTGLVGSCYAAVGAADGRLWLIGGEVGDGIPVPTALIHE